MQRNKLNLLPQNIRQKLNELIDLGFGDKICKGQIERIFVSQSPVLPASRNTYRAYIAQRKAEAKDISVPPSSNSGLTPENPPSGSLKAIKEMLWSQFQQQNGYITDLKDRLSTEESNPELEDQISRAEKTQRETIRLLIGFADDSTDNTTSQIFDKFKNELVDYVMLACRETHLEIYGDKGLEEYRNTLMKHLKIQSQNFTVSCLSKIGDRS